MNALRKKINRKVDERNKERAIRNFEKMQKYENAKKQLDAQ